MRTSRSCAALTVSSNTFGSPAWNPQAILAELTRSSTALSLPMVQLPKLSPRSLLRSMCRAEVSDAVLIVVVSPDTGMGWLYAVLHCVVLTS